MFDFQIEGSHLLLRERDIRAELQTKAHRSLRELIASKLRVSDECIDLRKALIPLEGPWGIGANIVDSWRVNFRPPELRETVEVTVVDEGIYRKLKTRKRQSYEQLMSLLRGFLRFNEKCVITTDDGSLIDDEIGFHEWMDGEEIRIWKTPTVLETEMGGSEVESEIEMLAHFRHETMSFRYTSELSPLWQARNWAAEEFGVRRNLLRMDIRFRNQRLVEVFLSKRLMPTEHFEYPALRAVWVGQDDR
jgi:hypothetical protein